MISLMMVIAATTTSFVGPVPDLDNLWAVSGLGSSGLTSGPFLGYQWARLVQHDSWDIDSHSFPVENYIKKL